MTFEQAEIRLKKLADGKYYSLSYDLSTSADGKKEARCWVYVDPRKSGRGATWKEAFSHLELMLDTKNPDLNEMPHLNSEK